MILSFIVCMIIISIYVKLIKNLSDTGAKYKKGR